MGAQRPPSGPPTWLVEMLRSCRSGTPLGALLAGLLFASPALADYSAGVEAYDGGDYATALQGMARGSRGRGRRCTGRLGQPVGHRRRAFGPTRKKRSGGTGKRPPSAIVVALLNLGDHLSRSAGTEKNLAEAYIWLSLSALQGMAWSAARLETIAEEMTTAEISAAEAEASRHPCL